MNMIHLISFIFTATALFSYINCRYLKLPTTIGLMVSSTTLAVTLVFVGELFPSANSVQWAKQAIAMIEFDEVVIRGMLGVLLFAGALHINFSDIDEQKWVIGLMATVGVVISTFVIGGVLYFALPFLSIKVPYLYCLLFGSLISPTDPIAVMSILKSIGASKALQTKISGESLFNDGVALVIFTVLSGMAIQGKNFTVESVAWLFIQESLGGIVLGLSLGYCAYYFLKQIDDYITQILITISLVLIGGTIAELTHVSSPIAAVCAGLFIGNHGRSYAMTKKSCEHLDLFWHLLDEILNSVLFVLLGLEILILTFDMKFFAAGLIAIPAVLIARFLGTASIINVLKFKKSFNPKVIKILTWGGLRGGISVALALSLPNSEHRELILTMTFIVVIFSVLVQGLTIKKLID